MNARTACVLLVLLLACCRTDPHVELKYNSSHWDGDGPNGVAHCVFLLTTDSDDPVFVDVGLPDHMLVWQGLYGGQWNSVDDFHIDENGQRMGHMYTLIYLPIPRAVAKSDPMTLESQILRCQVEDNVRYRVGIGYSATSDLHDSRLVYSDEFTLEDR